jgi:hypothetical protein
MCPKGPNLIQGGSETPSSWKYIILLLNLSEIQHRNGGGAWSCIDRNFTDSLVDVAIIV